MAASGGNAVAYTIYTYKLTTDALKDNTREAFGVIQLHTIDNVLKRKEGLYF